MTLHCALFSDVVANNVYLFAWSLLDVTDVGLFIQMTCAEMQLQVHDMNVNLEIKHCFISSTCSILLILYPFMLSAFFYLNSLAMFISYIGGVWLVLLSCFVGIFEINANNVDADLIRRCVSRHLICVFTVCKCPCYRPLGLNLLKKHSEKLIRTHPKRETTIVITDDKF